MYIELHRKAQQALREATQLKNMVQTSGANALPDNNEVPVQGFPEKHIAELAFEYEEIIEQSINEQLYKVDNKSTGLLRALSKKIGELHAGPKDVVRLHLMAMERLKQRHANEVGAAFIEESRMLLLQFLGELATFYRSLALGK